MATRPDGRAGDHDVGVALGDIDAARLELDRPQDLDDAQRTHPVEPPGQRAR